LMVAFKATLEELEDADLLLHLVDISNPRFEQQMESVENILEELNLKGKPRLIVFNKTDKVSREEVGNVTARYDAVAVSAIKPDSLDPLLKAIEYRIWESQKTEDFSGQVRV
ncbi:MAG: GTPase HflX, partial [Nitrospirae bacterium]|nr:GTPase HflX [Nitrospirota bacterium]